MDTKFKPTHELLDATGESRGLYLFDRGAFVGADTWFHGGRVIRECDLEDWGWRPKSLSDLFREHYATVHAHDGTDCYDGCGGY